MIGDESEDDDSDNVMCALQDEVDQEDSEHLNVLLHASRPRSCYLRLSSTAMPRFRGRMSYKKPSCC